MKHVSPKISNSVIAICVFLIVLLVAIFPEVVNSVAFLFSVFLFLALCLSFLAYRSEEKNNIIKIYDGKEKIRELKKSIEEVDIEAERSRLANQRIKQLVDIKVRAVTASLAETMEAMDKKILHRTLEAQKLAAELEVVRQQLQIKGKEVLTMQNKLKRAKKKNSILKT